jgi:hypothetical protein
MNKTGAAMAVVIPLIGSGVIFFIAECLSHSNAKSEAQLEERDRVIAELRGKQAASVNPAQSGKHTMQTNEGFSSAPDNSVMRQKMEALALRVELRLTRLENQIKQAGLVPLTRQENKEEIARLTRVLDEARRQLDAANQEVSRLALSIPEAVRKLSPSEAIDHPRYQSYRRYFAARVAEGYARNLVTDSENKIGLLSVKSY